MGRSDGNVIGSVQVENNGPRSRAWNLVFVSEGFRNAELDTFRQNVLDFRTELFDTYPFSELRRAINIFRIDVSSVQSGADDPRDCTGGTGANRRTFFDATFCGFGGIRRALTVNDGLVHRVVDNEVPEAHAMVVLVNSTIRGGTGGSVATSSLSNDWMDIVLHELGHTPFGLADEYEYWAGCGTDTDRDNHPNSEPSAPNVTRSAIGRKWRSLRTRGVPLPTTANADCTICDPQPNPFPAGIVGAFEGAHYYHCGAYRPEFNCKMRSSAYPDFCAVCSCRIWLTLAQHMPPIFLGNRNSREVHRIRSRNRNCQFCEIKRGNRIFFETLDQAHAAGYDNCHWCLRGSTR